MTSDLLEVADESELIAAFHDAGIFTEDEAKELRRFCGAWEVVTITPEGAYVHWWHEWYGDDMREGGWLYSEAIEASLMYPGSVVRSREPSSFALAAAEQYRRRLLRYGLMR